MEGGDRSKVIGGKEEENCKNDSVCSLKGKGIGESRQNSDDLLERLKGLGIQRLLYGIY